MFVTILKTLKRPSLVPVFHGASPTIGISIMRMDAKASDGLNFFFVMNESVRAVPMQFNPNIEFVACTKLTMTMNHPKGLGLCQF